MNIMFFLKPKSDLAFIYDYHTLRQALEIMEYHKYSCVPILNKEGKYVGSITEGDLLWSLKELDLFNIKEAESISIMKIKRRVDYQCVTAESNMEDLIGRAMEQNFVPVIDDQGHFIGIITRRDIIGYCYDRLKECGNYKEILKEIKNLGLKGIKLHPDYQDMYFDDIRYEHIVDTASELGLITVVHAGADPKCPKDVHCTPKMARKLLDDVKPEKLVLAHMGGNEMWDEVEKYLVGQNVYFDTGVILDRMPEEQFLRMVHMHGADRILFGTDSPWADQKKFVTLFDQMPLTEEEKMAVFSGNAKKLLGI